MFISPDRRPLLPSQEATLYQQQWKRERTRVLQIQELVRALRYLAANEHSKATKPTAEPERPVPTVLLTDSYVHETMSFYVFWEIVASVAGVFVAGVCLQELYDQGYSEAVFKVLLASLVPIVLGPSYFYKHLEEYKELQQLYHRSPASKQLKKTAKV